MLFIIILVFEKINKKYKKTKKSIQIGHKKIKVGFIIS